MATIVATDEDAGANGLVRYELVNPRECAPFSVMADSGAVRLVRPLDAEQRGEYECRVRARDHGLPESRSADTLVTVRIRDVNEHRPELKTHGRLDVFVPGTARPGNCGFL